MFLAIKIALERESLSGDELHHSAKVKRYLQSGSSGKSVGTKKTKLFLEYSEWLEDPKRYIEKKKKMKTKEEWMPYDHLFDNMVHLSSMFLVLKPMQHVGAIHAYCSRLRETGVTTMAPEDIIALGAKGLVKCSCQEYQHYARCPHESGVALQRKIIKLLDIQDERNPVRFRDRAKQVEKRMSTETSMEMQLIGRGYRSKGDGKGKY